MDRNPHNSVKYRMKCAYLSDFSFYFIPQHLMIIIEYK